MHGWMPSTCSLRRPERGTRRAPGAGAKDCGCHSECGHFGDRAKSLAVRPTERFFVARPTTKLLRMTGFVLNRAASYGPKSLPIAADCSSPCAPVPPEHGHPSSSASRSWARRPRRGANRSRPFLSCPWRPTNAGDPQLRSQRPSRGLSRSRTTPAANGILGMVLYAHEQYEYAEPCFQQGPRLRPGPGTLVLLSGEGAAVPRPLRPGRGLFPGDVAPPPRLPARGGEAGTGAPGR